ncbi:hypothetical protein NPL1_01535 [Metamycoplasma hyosynoviae]|nr:hypothetical protein NPL1_01535 [Metamycoplasma hyosynoviae]KDE45423.1 hypothetical protein NPL2_00800 [Metamycoplasma hyosynoviae]
MVKELSITYYGINHHLDIIKKAKIIKYKGSKKFGYSTIKSIKNNFTCIKKNKFCLIQNLFFSFLN